MALHKVNQDTYARIFKELLEGPITAHEAMEVSGIHRLTAYSLFKSLKKHKVVHISAWELDSMGRDAIAVYQLGAGKDKARRKMTPAERSRRYKAKKANLKLINMGK